jgi:hypothetical protein
MLLLGCSGGGGLAVTCPRLQFGSVVVSLLATAFLSDYPPVHVRYISPSFMKNPFTWVDSRIYSSTLFDALPVK